MELSPSDDYSSFDTNIRCRLKDIERQSNITKRVYSARCNSLSRVLSSTSLRSSRYRIYIAVTRQVKLVGIKMLPFAYEYDRFWLTSCCDWRFYNFLLLAISQF